MSTTIGNIILDGTFSDWSPTSEIDTSGNTVAGYKVYGLLVNDQTLANNYVLGISSTSASGVAIGAGTTIYLNTDQNTSTGYSPFGNIGAEYYVNFVATSSGLQPYLYAAGSNALVSPTPLNFGMSADGRSFELALPQILLTTAGAAPHSINVAAIIQGTTPSGSTAAAYLPGDFTNSPAYTIVDPATLATVDHTIKKVAIIYSATTANLFYGGGATGTTAYSDLFMAAQHQAEAAGVSYDLLTEADLTNVAKLAQYSALVFPSMTNVQSSQYSAIESALSQVVYNYHVPIITAGSFMSNDQNGNALAAPYAAEQHLLNLTQTGYGTATYSVTADAGALSNSIMSSYAAGQVIGGASGQFAGQPAGLYTNTGYLTFGGYTQAATTLADINIQGGATVAGVVQTTTGGTNVHFATPALLGDSNLLQHAIQGVVFGAAPSLALDVSRFAGVVASRTDMDQSQYSSDVSPVDANGNPLPGIYDKLLPLLQQWKQQYNFVGSYFINVGDNTNPNNDNSTDWSISNAYYRALLALGNEIGNHSYTHLVNPPSVDANGNPIPTTLINGVATSTWNENTNTLYVTPPANGSAPNWTYAYEFGASKTIEQQQIGIAIAGAAVPGANDQLATAQQIAQYYQSVAGGLTGYVSGGWTGVGSGSPNAFGYLTPSDTGAVYIAPNITFDFSEIQYQQKTPAQALADWVGLFTQLSANSQVPVIVWPWHDYGPTNWDTSGTGASAGYTSQMFSDFIAYAYGAGYEFVTEADLAARISAQQKATIHETTTGNVISATITPDAAAPDLGGMALNVINGALGQVIQNAGNWYAYDTNSIFLPRNGGSFTVTLGNTQDDVTHIDALPMRADLLSATGNGTNLSFAMTGDGTVGIHLKTLGAQVVSIQGAQTGALNGAELSLTFNDGALAISPNSPTGVAVQHNVNITEAATAATTTGNDIVFGGTADDTFSASGGNDYFNGGGGTNTVVFSGLITDYATTQNADGSVTFIDHRSGSPDGTDVNVNIQKYAFADGLILTKDQLGYAVVSGTAGNDTFTGQTTVAVNQIIMGLGGNDTLTAGIGNTVLDGGDGNDVLRDRAGVAASVVVTMSGGAGDDTYVVTRANDVIIEGVNAGIDTVQTNLATYTLPTNVENLAYTGTAGIVATGNALNNTFSGFRGTSTINGGGGTDTANFSSGFSNYHVTANTDGSVTLQDTRVGSPNGTTTLANISLFHFSDGLTLTASQISNSAATIVTGTTGNDTLTSPVAGALMLGLAGADTLTAGANNQTLDGGAGSDILKDAGFAGITLVGGGGNDTFVVSNSGTIVSELAGNGAATIQITLNAYALPANVSSLTFIGSGSFSSTATGSNETITGAAGADTLSDGGFANVRLAGGAGNDTFTVTNASTAVIESAGGGIDTVLTTLANYSLSANVENLTYTGTGAFTGNGNSLANIITAGNNGSTLFGNGGTDIFIGGAGNDRMTGGSAMDTFVFKPFNSVAGNLGIGKDVVTNFSANVLNTSHDVLEISSSLFSVAPTVASLFAGTATNAFGGTVSVSQSGANVVIAFDANDTITLNNVSLNTLKLAGAADIHFV